MPGRKANPGSYSYGFQNQETDPEMLVGAVAFKYRVHDARIGRFLSVDPLTPDYPWNSPYAFSENRLIDRVELEGLETGYTRYLDRAFSDRHLAKQTIEGNAAIVKRAVITAFKMPFPTGGTARALIEHYGYGRGQNYYLNVNQMLEVYPIVNRQNVPIDLSLTPSDFASVGEIKEGESKPFSKKFEVYAGTPGTLGNTSVTLDGRISINPETHEKEFPGILIYYDEYDFDEAEHRDFNAEGQVAVARNILPGDSFKVYGTLAVKQAINDILKTMSGINPAAVPKPKIGPEYGDSAGEAGDGGSLKKL